MSKDKKHSEKIANNISMLTRISIQFGKINLYLVLDHSHKNTVESLRIE